MFGMGPWELLIILAIVLLIFGPRRLKTLGSDLGTAIKGFRKAVNEREEKAIEGDTAREDMGDADAANRAAKGERESNV